MPALGPNRARLYRVAPALTLTVATADWVVMVFGVVLNGVVLEASTTTVEVLVTGSGGPPIGSEGEAVTVELSVEDVAKELFRLAEEVFI